MIKVIDEAKIKEIKYVKSKDISFVNNDEKIRNASSYLDLILNNFPINSRNRKC